MNKANQLSEQLRKLHEELAALRNSVERPSMSREDSTVNILAAQLKHVTEDVDTLRRALTPEPSRSFQDTTDALIKALELDVRLKELVNQKESSREPATANAAVSQPPLHAFSPLVRWSTLGFALVGAATGLFAGMSQSPVVATLLPMLFALLGGTGGIFIAKTDLRSPAEQERLRVIGGGLAAFIVLCILCSIWGVSRRTGQPPTAFFDWSAPAPSSMDGLSKRNAQANLNLVLLRSRLQALGATPTEQAAILNAVAESPTHVGPLSVAPKSAAEPLLKTAQSFQAAASALDAVSKARKGHEDIRSSQRLLRRWGVELQAWAARVGTSAGPRELLQDRLDDIALALKQFFNDLDSFDDAKAGTKYVSAVLDAQVSIATAIYEVKGPTAAQAPISKQQLDDADSLLRIMRAQAQPQNPLGHFFADNIQP